MVTTGWLLWAILIYLKMYFLTEEFFSVSLNACNNMDQVSSLNMIVSIEMLT